ncbi:hypothetical protein [Cronobacter turicensis]|uniref:hypothetical protein n=1 Tax=Cronobacter turicensis TaxID=413502 RepID=UPI0024C3FE82|nr:hypothetical protein [Cronobacter turicensis]MDK1185539.1 hypothetical protein [Cronobacter turicensis]MDK1205727.1 hypothetical protein [Cronobacter turicensis]MDK1213898.1 hypothetical protein [Cronobacter turicensis]MDK1218624.1 hypothetical protein [Cronobacter turicensis]MDK1229656.1 hypothetical protein [Cronobacter turicensis]
MTESVGATHCGADAAPAGSSEDVWQLTSDHKPRENVTRNRSQNGLAGLRERVEVKMINQHMMNKARRAAREALTKRNARKWDEANRIMRQAAASAFN